MAIHPTAIIDPKAELDSTVDVGPFSVIDAGVRVGGGTVIGPHCVLSGRTEIGHNNRLFSGAQVGVLCQDLKHSQDMVGRCHIGDNNVIREFVTISASAMRGPEDDALVTSVGSNCLLMACSHVGHDSTVGDRVIMANGVLLAGHVTVQDCVTLGGMVGIHQFCVVGQYAFCGGMARINKDVPPYMLCEGHPGRCFGPNTIGLQRSGFTPEGIKRIRTMYKLLYRSGLNTSQALARIAEEIDESPERETLVNFIQQSHRGIVR